MKQSKPVHTTTSRAKQLCNLFAKYCSTDVNSVQRINNQLTNAIGLITL